MEADDAALRARLGVRFAADGHVHTTPEAGGVAGAMGRLLAIVAAAQDEGTWARLKACLADDCQWAFYDRSRNRSAVWCDMKVCGNRQKVRSYRERHHRRAAAGVAPVLERRRAGVTRLPCQRHLERRIPADRGDDADVDTLALQHRSLLDVKLHVRRQ